MRAPSEPIFNVPTIVTATVALLCGVHVLRVYVLTPQQDLEVLLRFAFIPARYDPTILAQGAFPDGLAADIWTFVTYAFIHGDATHLGVNVVWLLAFATPIARRFGALRYSAFFVVTAAAGALAHLVTHPGALVPMVGASAAISGFMAAATRFVFQHRGPLGLIGRHDSEAYRVPAVPLSRILRDMRILIFLAAWFGLNFLFGVGSVSLTGSEQAVAWQAHIGGFLAGFLAFAVFDPVRSVPAADGTGPDAERSVH